MGLPPALSSLTGVFVENFSARSLKVESGYYDSHPNEYMGTFALSIQSLAQWGVGEVGAYSISRFNKVLKLKLPVDNYHKRLEFDFGAATKAFLTPDKFINEQYANEPIDSAVSMILGTPVGVAFSAAASVYPKYAMSTASSSSGSGVLSSAGTGQSKIYDTSYNGRWQ